MTDLLNQSIVISYCQFIKSTIHPSMTYFFE